MNIYAIFGANDVPALDSRVPMAFPWSRNVGPGQWIVAHASVLPNDVYEALKATGGDIFCIVVAGRGYYGWNDKAIWDWIDNASRAK